MKNQVNIHRAAVLYYSRGLYFEHPSRLCAPISKGPSGCLPLYMLAYRLKDYIAVLLVVHDAAEASKVRQPSVSHSEKIIFIDGHAEA